MKKQVGLKLPLIVEKNTSGEVQIHLLSSGGGVIKDLVTNYATLRHIIHIS